MSSLSLAALAAGAALAQAPSPPLRVGVEGAYPPFSEIGTDGKLKGLDIDIANAVCEKLQRKCELVQSEFDALIPALRAKKFDAVVASMSITPERRKNVDFSDKYYQTPARFIAKEGGTYSFTAEGLKGRKIGVQRTTIHDRFASATFKGSEILRYAKQDEAFLDLKAGRFELALVDSVVGDLAFLKTPAGKGFRFVGPEYTDPAFFGDGAGIAVRKGDDALRLAINRALAAIRADGSYKRIAGKYFEFDIYGAEPRK